MDIYKITAVGLVACIIAVLIKEYKPEFSVTFSVAVGAVMLFAVLAKFTPIISDIKYIASESGIDNEYLKLMLKSLGICYIAQFATDICNDFGQTSLASKIELCAKITLAALSLQPIKAIIEIIKETV